MCTVLVVSRRPPPANTVCRGLSKEACAQVFHWANKACVFLGEHVLTAGYPDRESIVLLHLPQERTKKKKTRFSPV